MVTQVTIKDKFKFGVKRACRSCGINFYDRDKHPSECPNCGAIYELHVNTRGRREVDPAAYNVLPFDFLEEAPQIEELSNEIEEDDPFSDMAKLDPDV